MKVFWDPVQLSHAPLFFLQRGQLRQNFETAARAEALLAACRDMRLEIVRPPAPPRSALVSVHDAAYLDFLRDGPAEWERLDDHGPELVANIHPSPEMLAQGAMPSGTIVGRIGWFTADTSCPITAATWPAAEAAAAGAIGAATRRPMGGWVCAGAAARASRLCRAGRRALLSEQCRNRCAAAARPGAARVAVLDIDSHHGNGTQGIFWDRGDVFFASVHGDPNGYYPWYVGHEGEIGAGDGAGCNLNLPLARGSGDWPWLAAIDQALGRIAAFGADALVVSLGFDASVDEPLRYLSVSGDGFARAGAAIAGTRLPCAIVQEGGYNLETIGGLLKRFLAAF